MSCNTTQRKHPRDQFPYDTPQKKAKLDHGVQEEPEDEAYRLNSSNQSRCDLTKWFSEKENSLGSEVEQGNTEAEEVEVLPSTKKLPEVYSFPRIDRKRVRKDEAAGSSYAIHDSIAKEVAGDSRAEMPYLSSDKEITDLFNDLWNSIDTLSRNYFSDVIPDAERQEWLGSIPKRLNPERAEDREFVHLVAQITVGGPCGIGSWEQIFLEPELRRGLVCGIIWRKLQGEVFDKMLFGGTDSQDKELLELEKSMAEDSDGKSLVPMISWSLTNITTGFMRTRARGLKVRQMLGCPVFADRYTNLTGEGEYPHGLDKACQTVTKQLHGLLSYFTPPNNSPQVLAALEEITCKAALISYLLRLDTETIYYFPFIEKDSCFRDHDVEENVTYFSNEHQDWLWSAKNRADKTVPHPQYGLTEEKVKRIHSYDPLIRIICSGAVETYRKGGWRPEDADKGVRKRTLFPARVILRWGRPQEKSSLPSGYQDPKSNIQDSPASYMSFTQAVSCLGMFRDRIALSSFGEGKGRPWYIHDHLQNGVRDPAWSVEGYPILGGRGTGNQPSGLKTFRPSRNFRF